MQKRPLQSRQILALFEETQAMHIADRDRIKQATEGTIRLA